MWRLQMVFMTESLETIWGREVAAMNSSKHTLRLLLFFFFLMRRDEYLGEFLLRCALLLEAALQSHVDFLLQLVHLLNICQPESVWDTWQGDTAGRFFYWELSDLRSSREVFSKLVIRWLLFSYYSNSWEQKENVFYKWTIQIFVSAALKCLRALPGKGFTGVSLKPANWIYSATSALSAWRDCLQGGCLRQDVKMMELWEYTASQAWPGIAADTSSDLLETKCPTSRSTCNYAHSSSKL